MEKADKESITTALFALPPTMTLLFENEEGESEAAVVDDIDYDSMSSEEFFDDLLRETAEKLEKSVEEVEEMDMEEIDEGLGTKLEKPYHPRGAREGYRDTDRLGVITKEEYKRIQNIIQERLKL